MQIKLMAHFDYKTLTLDVRDDVIFVLQVTVTITRRLLGDVQGGGIISQGGVTALLTLLKFFVPVEGGQNDLVHGEAIFGPPDIPASQGRDEFFSVAKKAVSHLLEYGGLGNVWIFVIQADFESLSSKAAIRAQLTLALEAGVAGISKLLPGPIRPVIVKKFRESSEKVLLDDSLLQSLLDFCRPVALGSITKASEKLGPIFEDLLVYAERFLNDLEEDG